MDADVLLTSKVVEGRVSIQIAKAIKHGYILNREKPRLLFIALFINNCKLQSVVLPLKPAGIKQIIGLFHGVVGVSLIQQKSW